eukprot:TRINITY_DN5800_c2_g1_i1.p1 TRINITY_DN5800_c2_g1~~TRINITY_DN5800_c2_g1_i1.p1  ORF type:complete len:568 (+),score=89.40 TRINITY_DN5800_c2_g1_i1:31-1734(+)
MQGGLGASPSASSDVNGLLALYALGNSPARNGKPTPIVLSSDNTSSSSSSSDSSSNSSSGSDNDSESSTTSTTSSSTASSSTTPGSLRGARVKGTKPEAASAPVRPASAKPIAHTPPPRQKRARATPTNRQPKKNVQADDGGRIEAEYHKSCEEKLRTRTAFTFREAAYWVLVHSQTTLNTNGIVRVAKEKGWLTTTGATPANTMHAALMSACKKGNSPFITFVSGQFSVLSRIASHACNMLLPLEWRRAGMQFFPKSMLKHIPKEKEWRWLEFRKSTIPGTGLGLFCRKGARFERGTIFCEYYGRKLPADPSNRQLPYGITAYNNPEDTNDLQPFVVDGIDAECNVLCFAAFANDCGPTFSNTNYVSFGEKPGHVFLEATRDIEGGEEIFVAYGLEYWGINRYPDWPSRADWARLPSYAAQAENARTSASPECSLAAQRTKALGPSLTDMDPEATTASGPQWPKLMLHPLRLPRKPEEAEKLFGNVRCGCCPKCAALIPRRAMVLHTTYCGQPERDDDDGPDLPCGRMNVTVTKEGPVFDYNKKSVREPEAATPATHKRRRMNPRQ